MTPSGPGFQVLTSFFYSVIFYYYFLLDFFPACRIHFPVFIFRSSDISHGRLSPAYATGSTWVRRFESVGRTRWRNRNPISVSFGVWLLFFLHIMKVLMGGIPYEVWLLNIFENWLIQMKIGCISFMTIFLGCEWILQNICAFVMNVL